MVCTFNIFSLIWSEVWRHLPELHGIARITRVVPHMLVPLALVKVSILILCLHPTNIEVKIVPKKVEIKPLKLKTMISVSTTWSQFSFKLLCLLPGQRIQPGRCLSLQRGPGAVWCWRSCWGSADFGRRGEERSKYRGNSSSTYGRIPVTMHAIVKRSVHCWVSLCFIYHQKLTAAVAAGRTGIQTRHTLLPMTMVQWKMTWLGRNSSLFGTHFPQSFLSGF